MAFENPVVGGDQLVRDAIKSSGYQQGTFGWTINRDGSAEFNNLGSWTKLAAKQSFTYQGDELSTLLNQRSGGILARGTVPTANLPTPAVGATETAIMELDALLLANRSYQIFLANVEIQANGGPCRPVARVRYTLDGTTPTTASSTLFDSFLDLGSILAGAAYAVPAGQSDILTFTSNTQLRLLLTTLNQIITSGGAQQTHQFVATGSGVVAGGPSLVINDIGLSTPNTGKYLGTGTSGQTTGPTKQYKTFRTVAVDSQSFNGVGQAVSGSNSSYMYYGPDPSGYNGNMLSMCWFDIHSTAGGNGLGSVADMNGIPASDVSWCDIYVDTAWWYSFGGGTLHIGSSGYGINHSGFPGGTYNQVQQNFTQRGQGIWISVLGTPILTSILNGTFDALILGPGVSGQNDYGYAYGYGTGDPPEIRAGYFK